MKPIKLAVMLVALSLTACGKDKPTGSSDQPATGSKDQPATGNHDKSAGNDLCTRGVTHVSDLMASQGKGHPAPGADEQRVIDLVKQTSIEQCQHEGFTQAQLDCVLAAMDWQKLGQVGECAAIKDKRPTWLRIP